MSIVWLQTNMDNSISQYRHVEVRVHINIVGLGHNHPKKYIMKKNNKQTIKLPPEPSPSLVPGETDIRTFSYNSPLNTCADLTSVLQ